MKIFFLCFTIISVSCLHAQTKVTKYYDGDWVETIKEKAVFYADFLKEGNSYQCTSYWINSNALRGKSTYPDTVLDFPIGAQMLYYKNGHIEDSSFFLDKHTEYSYHYYPNNKLAAHYYLPDDKREGVVEGYDESGNKIKNYIFLKEAEFKGGQKSWESFISKSASKDLSVKSESTITATVKVQFVIDESGDVIRPKVIKSSGFKNVDNDALRVIADSPKWTNCVQYNKPVKSVRVQPVSYILEPEKPKK